VGKVCAFCANATRLWWCGQMWATRTLCIPRGAVHRFDNLHSSDARGLAIRQSRASSARTTSAKSSPSPKPQPPPSPQLHPTPKPSPKSCAATASPRPVDYPCLFLLLQVGLGETKSTDRTRTVADNCVLVGRLRAVTVLLLPTELYGGTTPSL
jgi:hypothetical protein